MSTQAGGRRPSRKLMVLSGAAIFAVYVAGYARTQAAADQWQTAPAQLAPSAAGGVAAANAAGSSATSGNGAGGGGAATGSAAAGASGGGGTAASPANCTTSSTSSAAIAPPAVTYRSGEGYGDDGRRGRGRGRDDSGTAYVLPAAQAQTPCPPASPQASGQQAAAGSATQARAPSQPAATTASGSGATQAQGQTQGQGQATSPASQSQQGQQSQAAQAKPPAAATTPASPPASPYKDGVYAGTGWSRHGSVSVALTIKSGKMTSVVVTGCTTHYPCADVSPMPGEVLSAQSLQVNTVSGATDSSMAFLGAVQQALQSAQAAQG